MINMQELEDFEKILQSGQLEDSFKYGNKEERVQLLNILEKLMDIGEEADKLATRLLMPGIAGMGKNT